MSFTSAIVSRVRITNGNLALGAGINETSANDLVVMDDFLYGEPRLAAVPDSGMTISLLGGALAALMVADGLRKRLALRKA